MCLELIHRQFALSTTGSNCGKLDRRSRSRKQHTHERCTQTLHCCISSISFVIDHTLILRKCGPLGRAQLRRPRGISAICQEASEIQCSHQGGQGTSHGTTGTRTEAISASIGLRLEASCDRHDKMCFSPLTLGESMTASRQRAKQHRSLRTH